MKVKKRNKLKKALDWLAEYRRKRNEEFFSAKTEK